MDTWNIIDTCGEELGVKAEARRKWRERGVPGKWHLALIQKARDNGMHLPAESLLQRPERVA